MFIKKKKVEKNRLKIGKAGEKLVSKKLRKYSLLRGYKVIDDIYLPIYDKTTQIDHILVGTFGILVVETKNLTGQVYGNGFDENWSQFIGDKKHKFYNPIKQNQGHINAIRSIFQKENIYKVNIESAVVFPAKKIELYTQKELPVYHLKQLMKMLRTEKYETNNSVDIERICNVLNHYKVEDKKALSNHNKNVKKIAKSKY